MDNKLLNDTMMEDSLFEIVRRSAGRFNLLQYVDGSGEGNGPDQSPSMSPSSTPSSPSEEYHEAFIYNVDKVDLDLGRNVNPAEIIPPKPNHNVGAVPRPRNETITLQLFSEAAPIILDTDPTPSNNLGQHPQFLDLTQLPIPEQGLATNDGASGITINAQGQDYQSPGPSRPIAEEIVIPTTTKRPRKQAHLVRPMEEVTVFIPTPKGSPGSKKGNKIPLYDLDANDPKYSEKEKKQILKARKSKAFHKDVATKAVAYDMMSRDPDRVIQEKTKKYLALAKKTMENRKK